jgi:hypothetical protein
MPIKSQPPTPWMNSKLIKLLSCFDWGDHEYLRWEFGRWPFKFWITIYEKSWRRGFSRLFPWRLRCALASVLIKALYSRCTICNERIRLWELLRRNSGLIHFQSGSIVHRDCSQRGGVDVEYK